jgi:hypothetical protein
VTTRHERSDTLSYRPRCNTIDMNGYWQGTDADVTKHGYRVNDSNYPWAILTAAKLRKSRHVVTVEPSNHINLCAIAS